MCRVTRFQELNIKEWSMIVALLTADSRHHGAMTPHPVVLLQPAGLTLEEWS